MSSTRILVAEDDAKIRAWLREVLEIAGYGVIEAASGKKAMDLLTRETVDLVITDLRMPEQGGIETIRLIRHEYPTLKIIVISGAFGPEFLRVSKILGAAAALEKPLQAESLLDTVKALIGK